MLLGVIGVIVLFATILTVVAALNHYSGKSMDKMGEAKSGFQFVGWWSLWIGLAAVAALVWAYGMSTANKASQSSQPPASSYQPSPPGR
jgi:hypothetical protein